MVYFADASMPPSLAVLRSVFWLMISLVPPLND
jgi:hypothetical protein